MCARVLVLGREGPGVADGAADPLGELVVRDSRSSELTRSHPGISRPPMTATVAVVVWARAADSAGPTRTRAPP